MSISVNMMSDLARNVVAGQGLVNGFMPTIPQVDFYNIRLGLGTELNNNGSLPSAIVTDIVNAKFFSVFERARFGTGIKEIGQNNRNPNINLQEAKNETYSNIFMSQEVGVQTSPASNGFDLKSIEFQAGSEPICISNVIIKGSQKIAPREEVFIPIGDLGFLCGHKWSWGTVLEGNRQRCIWLDGKSNNSESSKSLHLDVEDMAMIFKFDKREKLKETLLETTCTLLRETENITGRRRAADYNEILKSENDDETFNNPLNDMNEEIDRLDWQGIGDSLIDGGVITDEIFNMDNDLNQVFEDGPQEDILSDRVTANEGLLGEMNEDELFSKQTLTEQLFPAKTESMSESGSLETSDISEKMLKQMELEAEKDLIYNQMIAQKELSDEVAFAKESLMEKEFLQGQLLEQEDIPEEYMLMRQEELAEKFLGEEIALAKQKLMAEEALAEENLQQNEELSEKEMLAEQKLAEEKLSEKYAGNFNLTERTIAEAELLKEEILEQQEQLIDEMLAENALAKKEAIAEKRLLQKEMLAEELLAENEIIQELEQKKMAAEQLFAETSLFDEDENDSNQIFENLITSEQILGNDIIDEDEFVSNQIFEDQITSEESLENDIIDEDEFVSNQIFEDQITSEQSLENEFDNEMLPEDLLVERIFDEEAIADTILDDRNPEQFFDGEIFSDETYEDSMDEKMVEDSANWESYFEDKTDPDMEIDEESYRVELRKKDDRANTFNVEP